MRKAIHFFAGLPAKSFRVDLLARFDIRDSFVGVCVSISMYGIPRLIPLHIAANPFECSLIIELIPC